MLAFYTPTFAFTKAQLVDMLSLQCKANDVMSDNWRLSCNCDIQYYRASNMEGIEAIDHMSWKWWKKLPDNVEQVVLELIDILHFSLSHSAREAFVAANDEQGHIDNVDEILEDAADEILAFDHTVTIEPIGKYRSDDAYEKLVITDGEVDFKHFPLVDLLELFSYNTLLNAEPSRPVLYAAFDHVGLSADAIYKRYVDKNLLNIFRTSNGQRTNDYYKIWDGKEDNEHMTAYRLQKEADGETYTVNELLQWMTETYQAHVAAGTVAKG